MINFSGNENLDKLIEFEKVFITSNLDIQKNLNKQILIFMKKFVDEINISTDTTPLNHQSFFYLDETHDILNKSNSIIKSLNDLLENLNTFTNLSDNLEEKIENYNINSKKVYDSVFTNTKIIELFIYRTNINNLFESAGNSFYENVVMLDHKNHSLNTTITQEKTSTEPESPISTEPNINIQQENIDFETSIITDSKSEVSMNSTENSSENNEPSSINKSSNTLIISDTQQKVILPYDINIVTEILENYPNLYTSIQDVITKIYTKPISYYRFSSISRFKEAFKLVKDREKGSLLKALGLAFELFGNYNLHPAIITACSCLDELDIYLACLEDNTLNDFKFFDIKFEIPLTSSKFAKSNT